MGLIKPPPTVKGIEAAYSAIDPVFLDTPLLESEAANAAFGCRVLAKVETLNPTRAFKGRGTDWFVQNLVGPDQPLVAASAGNFGQGLAYAARKRNQTLVMFAATTANPLKVEAMRRLGADVRLAGSDFDAAKSAARAFAAAHGHLMVEDGAEPTIAEGAGTIALELTQQLAAREHRADIILVPLGNGALLTGIGTWLKAKSPNCRVVGIVAEVAPSMLRSWSANASISTATAPTIADGIGVREPVHYALECMRTTVDDVWSVPEAALRHAMRLCHQHYGLVVEPAGAAGIAAVLEYSARLKSQTVATVLCGGNLTPEQMQEYLA
jgi:threonine dehydratase